MEKFHVAIYRVFVNIVGVGIASFLFDSIKIDSFFLLGMGAIILTLMNTFLKPVILLITLPLQVMSFGLFYLVTNAAILKISASFIDGFHIGSFWAAVGGSMIIGLVNMVFDVMSARAEYRYFEWK